MSGWRRRVSEVKEKGGGTADVDKFMIKTDGEYAMRFFPFKHKVTQADIQLGRYAPDELGKEMEELFVETRTHWIQRKPFTCGKIRNQMTDELVGDCEHCDTVARLYRSQYEADKKEASGLKANEKYVVNMVLVSADGVAGGLQVYDTPKSLANKILASLDSRALKGKEVMGSKGRDCLVIKDKSKGPAGMYDMIWLDEADSKFIEQPPVHDLFAMPLFIPPAFRTLLSAPDKAEAPKTAPKEEEPIRKTRAKKDPWLGKMVSVTDGEESIEGKVVSGPEETADGIEYTVEIENGDKYSVTTDLMELIEARPTREV